MKVVRILFATLSLHFAGCMSQMVTTLPLAESPRITYSGLIIQPLGFELTEEPNHKVCSLLMDEIAYRVIWSEAFDNVHVVGGPLIHTARDATRRTVTSVTLDSLERAGGNIAELHVTVIEYNKGVPGTRLLVGVLAGGGALGIKLKLVDRRLGHSVIEASSRKTIRGSYSSQNDVVKPLARSVAWFIADKMRVLRTNSSS